MQRRLQDDVARSDDIQHLPLLVRLVHADKLLVKGNGQGRLTTELRHIEPLSLSDGLFYAVDVVLRQQFELIERILVREGAVGIDAQFHLVVGETLTDALYQVQLMVKVDGTNLQLHTAEALFQLLLHALKHLLVGAHPDKTIDGNARLSTTESRIEEEWKVKGGGWKVEGLHGGFQSEEHGGVVTQCFVRNLSRLLHLVTEATQHLGIVGNIVARQLRQRGTLADARPLSVRDADKPATPLGIYTATRACRLFEMEHTLLNINLHGT